MVIAHVRVWAPLDSEVVKIAITLVNNVASPLFCLVMGVAAGLVLTRTARPVRQAAFVARNVVRGLALIAIGLLIEDLPSNIAIVLQVLGDHHRTHVRKRHPHIFGLPARIAAKHVGIAEQPGRRVTHQGVGNLLTLDRVRVVAAAAPAARRRW